MRKVLYVLGIALLVPLGLVSAIIAMLWITTGTGVSVNVNNDSPAILRHVVVTTPTKSAPFDTLSPGDSAAFSDDPRFIFDVHVSFDADNRHYDLPGRAYLIPFGNFILRLSVDHDMKLFVHVSPI